MRSRSPSWRPVITTARCGVKPGTPRTAPARARQCGGNIPAYSAAECRAETPHPDQVPQTAPPWHDPPRPRRTQGTRGRRRLTAFPRETKQLAHRVRQIRAQTPSFPGHGHRQRQAHHSPDRAARSARRPLSAGGTAIIDQQGCGVLPAIGPIQPATPVVRSHPTSPAAVPGSRPPCSLVPARPCDSGHGIRPPFRRPVQQRRNHPFGLVVADEHRHPAGIQPLPGSTAQCRNSMPTRDRQIAACKPGRCPNPWG